MANPSFRNNEHAPVLNAQDARQGKELGSVRWVLHISLALAVVAGVVLWLIYFG
jgi:hypothetical protein